MRHPYPDSLLPLVKESHQLLEQCWVSWVKNQAMEKTLFDRIARQQEKLLPYQPHHDFFTASRESDYFKQKAESLTRQVLSAESIAKVMADTHARIGLLHHLYYHFEQLKQACETATAKQQLETEARALATTLAKKRASLQKVKETVTTLHREYEEVCHEVIETTAHHHEASLAPHSEGQIELPMSFHPSHELVVESMAVIDEFWKKVDHDELPSNTLVESMAVQREKLAEYRESTLSVRHSAEYFKRRLEYQESTGVLSEAIHDEMVNHHLWTHI
ncbi:MAG: hypothetical protein GY821_00080 [Gammaproteobacteria bacterium]|nr:hypothetical protein [Gammaproteobacteria bacterium]